MQTDRRRDRRRSAAAFGMVTVVCLALLALLAVVQVAHMHPIEKDADHCPLCIVMQTAAPVAVMATIVILVSLWSPTPVVEARAVVLRQWHPKLFSRPPPAGC